MPDEKAILPALKKFAAAVTAKMNQITEGDPEDQLRGPFEIFVEEVGKALALEVVSTGETMLAGRLGKPDYAVHATQLLAGYVELKAPGVGANPKHFKGHNKDQWKRFTAIPNLIYTDGNEWGLYRFGERQRPLVRLIGDVSTDGEKAVCEKDAKAVLGLLTDFLQWQPTIPTKAKGKINLKAFSGMLAPLCGMLRGDVTDALKDPQSPLVLVADDWRQLLFPDANDEQFADAYAQTVTFALLLARSEGADLKPPEEKPETQALFNAESALAVEHSMLSQALRALTDPGAQAEISASLNLLIRVIAEVPRAALSGPQDPWLYFYEDFLAVYDSKLRKAAGAYYTPVEVVRAQIRLIDDLLTNRLHKPLGFADPDVITLDPATGTGTYLLGVIAHALRRIESEEGDGAVPGQATTLAKNLYGFELMAGPYAVAELRVSRAIRDQGGKLSKEGLGIYLTDTLESPYIPPRDAPHLLREMAGHHKQALKIKRDERVLVCLGNPPYGRHEAADETNKARTGGWVRWGTDEKGEESILQDFIKPALAMGRGRSLTGLYNLYVYFWRWALWKVFEWQKEGKDEDGDDVPVLRKVDGPGIVSFISASSYLDGDAFHGMREHMRRLCDEIWILDLGGEGRGTRRDENVFAIQTPVAIAVAVRYSKAQMNTPAIVRYAPIAIGDTRNAKLKALDGISDLASLEWEVCPDDWQSPFRPVGTGAFFDWPLLKNLIPWQQPGVKTHRTWMIGVDETVLQERWRVLLHAENRAEAFAEDSGRRIGDIYSVRLTPNASLVPIADLPSTAPVSTIQPYAFRSFDRQVIIADGRLMTRPRPVLWHVHGAPAESRQVYVTTLLKHPMGNGPGAMACASIPDVHHFRGSYGGKDVLPLYRDAHGREPNILPGLTDLLTEAYGQKVTPENFLAYVYGVLAQPAFTEWFSDELGKAHVHIPLTKDGGLFAQMGDVGAKLLWLHTYGQRFVPKGKQKGQLLKGSGKCTKAVPGDMDNYPEKYEYNEPTKTLHVGDGEFGPVAQEVYEFEVSGLKVVQSWLAYRMKNPKGKKSSPLDEINPEKWPSEFTTELLELLWVLEATVAEYPAQAKLLAQVVKGKCFKANELPDVPDAARKAPQVKKQKGLFDEAESDGE